MKKIAIQLNEKYYSLDEPLRFFIAIVLAYPGIFIHPLYLLILFPMVYIKNATKKTNYDR